MAVSFNKAKGEAQKSDVTYMKLANGLNTFRLVGGLLPRYVYWVAKGDKSLPFECLQFDRENERFDRSFADPVAELGLPDPKAKNKDGSPANLRCQWSYTCQVLNRATGNIEVLALRKGILQGMQGVWEALEVDPTDFDTGIEFVVERKKTGPLPINIEYQVQQLRCKSAPLSAEDREKVLAAKSIDELFPRQTAEEQRAALAKFLASTSEGSTDDEAIDDEAMDELE